MSRGSFPHPVLDESDDVLSQFVVQNVVCEGRVDTVDVRFDVKLDDDDLLAMLDDGEARLSVKWRCSATMVTREEALSPQQSAQGLRRYVLVIPQEEVLGDVRVTVRIVAARHIEEYRLHRQNPEYGDATFEVFPGDLLADGGVFTFNPRKAYDPLVPPLESCFRFESAFTKTLEVQIDDPEQVVVLFPRETFEMFAGQQGRPELQVSLVVLPALMNVLWRMRENSQRSTGEESFEDFQWFRAIKNALDSVNASDDDPFLQAQKILDGNPIGAALAKLNVDDEEDR